MKNMKAMAQTVVQNYRRDMAEATDRVIRLAKEHGEECKCYTCTQAWGTFNALQDNPPCFFCYGDGCRMCQFTGWR